MHVVLAHSNRDFRYEVEDALLRSGFQVSAIGDATPAWLLVQQCDVLVTEILLPAGQSAGVALARGGQLANARLEVLFLAAPHAAESAHGIGEVLPLGTAPDDIVGYLRRILWWRTASAWIEQTSSGRVGAGSPQI
jgi:hypothetical protein